MKAWNRKHKPKHWTKLKWRTKEKYKIKNYCLITRGIKNKYKNNYFLSKIINNKPRIKIISMNLGGWTNGLEMQKM